MKNLGTRFIFYLLIFYYLAILFCVVMFKNSLNDFNISKCILFTRCIDIKYFFECT